MVVDQVETPLGPSTPVVPRMVLGFNDAMEAEEESGPINPKTWQSYLDSQSSKSCGPMIDLNNPPAVLILDNRDGGGVGSGDGGVDDNCSMSEKIIWNVCVGTHRWEECNLPSYAKAMGVVCGRRCFVC